MTATQVKARLLGILDEVQHGEEVEITRHGRAIARLVPARGPNALRGRFEGIATSSERDADLYSTGVTWEVE